MMNNLPKIALGTWSWGIGNVGGDQVFGNQLGEKELKPVFDAAMENGLNLWDTAVVYGMGASETILGKLAADYPREKVIYSTKFTPDMHFHWNKMEEIINRVGGNVLITVYNSTEDGQFDDTDVTVNCDGHEYTVPAGTQVKLTPGESITIYPYMYHDFHVEEGRGDVLLGEVSMCNDDENDNRFYEPIGRFPEIEEDEEPYRLLCTEYPKAKQKLIAKQN